MSNKPPSFVEWIRYKLAAKFLSLGVVLCTSVLALLLVAVAERTGIRVFFVVGALLFIIGLWAAILPAREIAFRMEDDRSMSFSTAAAHTIYRYLLYVAFIPLIGPFVQGIVEKKKVNPFVSDEGRDSNQPTGSTKRGST